jgi:predicted DNA-binding protein (MmcQ/YjbR family)
MLRHGNWARQTAVASTPHNAIPIPWSKALTGKQPRGLALAGLDALCGRWPGVTRDIKWSNNPVFSVGGKMFVMTHADGSEGGRLSFKVADDRFLELTDQPGIIPAPYLARARWVSVTDPERFATAELQAFVLDAYALVRAKLTKKLQAELGSLPALEDRP